MGQLQFAADLAALQFYLDAGVDEVVGQEPVDRFKLFEKLPEIAPVSISATMQEQAPSAAPLPMGKSDAYKQAVEMAQAAGSLDELKQTIADFDGITLKKTATNIVFADGNPNTKIMLIGDVPEAEDDRQGKAFAGPSGQLLDKILASIALSRAAEELEKSVYITNLLNWRPPGGRSPSPAEIQISTPFVERHIQLIKPDILILFGKTVAQTLLGSSESLSKIRRAGWHNYTPQTDELNSDTKAIQMIVTHHPATLLTTPVQKKAVWQDMLTLQARLRSL